MEDVHSILRRCPYFRGVPPGPMHVIATHGETFQVPPLTVLCEEGSDADNAWVLGRGAVESRKKLDNGQDELLATLKPGSLFGHISLLDDGPRSATLVTVAQSELVRFSASDFRRLVNDPGGPGRFFRRAMILALGDTVLAAAAHLKEVTQAENGPIHDDPEQFMRRVQERLSGGR